MRNAEVCVACRSDLFPHSAFILRPVEIVLNGSGTDKKRGGCRAGLRWPGTAEFCRCIALATHAGRARGEQRPVRCDMSSAGNAVLFQA